MKPLINHFTFRLLLACLFIMAGTKQMFAWDTKPGANGKYDKYFDRPTHFPDWTQPSDWPNAEYYLVCARFSENGQRIENYEVAVYDQNGKLRHCNRSRAKDNHLCTLTIKGEEGDQFHCQIIYGDDFEHPMIVDAVETFGFGTNDIVGSKTAPYWLTLRERTLLSETSSEPIVSETCARVTVKRTIAPNEWGTICLPFAMTASQVKTAFGEDVELANFKGCVVGYEDDGETVKSINVTFADTTAMKANHPYIIKVREQVKEFEVDGVDIVALGENEKASVDCDKKTVTVGNDAYDCYNRFVGNYQNDFIVPEQSLFLSGGKFWYSTGKTKMMPFRAYFDFYDVLPDMVGAGSRIAMTFDNGAPTAIEPIVHSTGSAQVQLFDLQGRRVMKAQSPGLYIQNGRKFFVR